MSAVKIAVQSEPVARQSLDTKVICSIILFPGFHSNLASNAWQPLSTLDLLHLMANTPGKISLPALPALPARHALKREPYPSVKVWTRGARFGLITCQCTHSLPQSARQRPSLPLCNLVSPPPLHMKMQCTLNMIIMMMPYGGWLL